MADTPESACQGGASELPLARDNGSNRNYVIGVRGVTHPQKKTYSDDGKKADHFLFFCITLMQARVAERRSADLRARKLKNSSIPAPVLDEIIKTCMPSRTDCMLVRTAASSNSTAGGQVHLGNYCYVCTVEYCGIF
jgi:hypothetical protein